MPSIPAVEEVWNYNVKKRNLKKEIMELSQVSGFETKKTYCVIHKKNGHATKNFKKLEDIAAATFAVGELTEIDIEKFKESTSSDTEGEAPSAKKAKTLEDKKFTPTKKRIYIIMGGAKLFRYLINFI